MIERRDLAPWSLVSDRLDTIERRLSRIEGGLVLGGFIVTVAVALLGKF